MTYIWPIYLLEGTCDEVRCDGHKICVLRRKKVTCVCPECTEEERKTGPVCSSEHNTYSSLCALKRHTCRVNSQEEKLSDGPCVKGM